MRYSYILYVYLFLIIYFCNSSKGRGKCDIAISYMYWFLIIYTCLPRRSGLLFLFIAFWIMFALEHGSSWHHRTSLINKRTFGIDAAKTEARNFASCPWKHAHCTWKRLLLFENQLSL